MTKRRFFFAIEGGVEPSPDEFGSEFDSLEAAYIEGCRAALEISMEMLRDRLDPNSLRFEISGADGRILVELPFAEVLRPAARRQRPETVTPALLRLRQQASERRRLVIELASTLDLTTSTMATTRGILDRSRRQSGEASHLSADRPLHTPESV